MANRDKITGTWTADSTNGVIGGIDGDMVISYPGKIIEGTYDYKRIRGRRATANLYALIRTKIGPGVWQTGNKKIGEFKAKTDFAADLPPISSGEFVANENSGRFRLFYEGTMFATGNLNNSSDFF